jgi:hypothetical protein
MSRLSGYKNPLIVRFTIALQLGMRIDFFERDYRHLSDSDDAVNVLGLQGIAKGIATVGDIRRACEGHPKDASIKPENNASGFWISDVKVKFSC